MSPAFKLDHLVVATSDLDVGARWCQATLGVVPTAGGRHALMATHNRLLSIAAPRFPQAYLEIIAIDPSAARVGAPGRRRWFGLDDAALQARLARVGAQFVHWVARVSEIDAARDMLARAQADPGEPTAAARDDYRWRITLRDDGVPQRGGVVPSLILWESTRHPTDAMPASDVTLSSLRIGGAEVSAGAVASLVDLASTHAPALEATLLTPRGPVVLCGFAT